MKIKVTCLSLNTDKCIKAGVRTSSCSPKMLKQPRALTALQKIGWEIYSKKWIQEKKEGKFLSLRIRRTLEKKKWLLYTKTKKNNG